MRDEVRHEIFARIGPTFPVPVRDLQQLVKVYGRRRFFWALQDLLSAKVIKRIGKPKSRHGGYVRA